MSGLPLSAAEAKQFKELMARAQHHHQLDSPDDDFSLVDGGAMTDASKRGCDSGYSSQPTKRTPFVAEDPVESPVDGQVICYTTAGQPVTLPPGVDDIETWGRTVVGFGKHLKSNLSYAEMYNDTSAEGRSYVNYLISHVNSSKGAFHDCALYCVAMDYYKTGSQMPVLPGTNTRRALKPKA